MRFSLIFVLMLFFQLPFALPHLDNGENIVKNGYIIDFGYSPKNPIDKGTTFLSFNLVNETTEKPAEFDSAWIRISSSKEVVFSGTIKGSGGNAFIEYSFPYHGDYAVKVQFKDASKEIIQEADFSIRVLHTGKTWEIFLLTAIMLLALALVKYKKIKFQDRKWKR